MSYDLYFRSRSRSESLTSDEFASYFTGRRFCEVNSSQVWYSNEDSGVYFSFDYSEREEDSDSADEADTSLLPVSFNLNYFRPHPFGLEAEPEVAAFVKKFDLTVSDPQTSGMGDGYYSREGFLSGWNDGNEFGYRAILSQDVTHRFLTLPSTRISSAWRWNYRREARQVEIGDRAFVPRIFFLNVHGTVQTAVVWGDGIPILLPEVDLVLVPRQRLAPRRLLHSKNDTVVFSWDDLRPIVSRFKQALGEPVRYDLTYEETPPHIERAIREKQPPSEMPEGLRFDQVLDQELIERARGRT